MQIFARGMIGVVVSVAVVGLTSHSTRVRVPRSFLVPLVVGLLVSAVLATSEVAASAVAKPAATFSQRGINVVVQGYCGEPTRAWQRLATNEMNGVKSLRANSVALAFPFYTQGLLANSVFPAVNCPSTYPAGNTPSTKVLTILVKAAHAAGLHVLLRPLLDGANLQPKWRGFLAPTDKSAWFSSYQKLLKPYLQMAQANGVEDFTISAELESLRTSPQWPSVIKWAKLLYSGHLGTDSAWPFNGRDVAQTGFAVDAYPPTTAKPSASVATLLADWNAWLGLKPLPANTAIHEVGIPASDGAYKAPYDVFAPGTFDQSIQANWFTAACDFAKSRKIQALYFWGPFIGFNGGELLSQPDPSHTAELQPAALTAIRACFT